MTCIGALPLYISNEGKKDIQPMNANFGIIDSWHERVRGGKVERYKLIAKRALEELSKRLGEL